MAVFQEPTQWSHELGNNADVSTLPDDTGATTGVASLQKLFQLINQTPLEAGGVAPDREDFNALFKILGDSVFYGMNGGLASYNPAYDYAVGRFVVYNDTLYKCIQANGASSTVVAPDSVSPLGSDYWKDIENQDSTSLIPNQTIISELPLTDANLHLKDGALLSGSGAYSDYVDLIAEIYNSGDATTSFCTEAEWQTSNTNYGFCNKFVYDSVANTVRLPKVNSEHGALIKSYSSGSAWYRIYQDGWCEQGDVSQGGGTVTLHREMADTSYIALESINNDNDGNTNQVDWQSAFISIVSTSQIKMSTAFNWTKSWFVCGYTDISDLQVSPIYEYIVVGTVSKTDIQIDIDNVMADLALKADKDLSNVPSSKGILVESYVNGTSWYRVYSDGWCEQGGVTPSISAQVNTTINLLINFKNTDYFVNANQPLREGSYLPTVGITSKTVSNFIVEQSSAQNAAGAFTVAWQAKGYIS